MGNWLSPYYQNLGYLKVATNFILNSMHFYLLKIAFEMKAFCNPFRPSGICFYWRTCSLIACGFATGELRTLIFNLQMPFGISNQCGLRKRSFLSIELIYTQKVKNGGELTLPKSPRTGLFGTLMKMLSRLIPLAIFSSSLCSPLWNCVEKEIKLNKVPCYPCVSSKKIVDSCNLTPLVIRCRMPCIVFVWCYNFI